MRGSARAFAALVVPFIGGAMVAACGAFGSDDTSPPLPPRQEPSVTPPPPTPAEPAEAGADGDVDAGPPPCPTTPATETLALSADAVLNPSTTTNHQDLSDVQVCNLAVLDCLVAFTRAKSIGKRILSLSLELPRATSTGCGGACTDATFHAAGKIAVQHMRVDWDEKATWFARHALPVGGAWYADGATGPLDATGIIATGSVTAQDDAVIPIDGAALSPSFLGDPVLAFRVAGQPPFEYVLQRVTGSATSRASLLVTYCTE